MQDCQIIILAAGKGSRMNSDLPKVMHKVGGRPMIELVIENAKAVTDNIVLVHSEEITPYITSYNNTCKFALQKEPLGTAHAVLSAEGLLTLELPIAVIFGDNPLITPSLIKDLLQHLESQNAKVGIIAFDRTEPSQYGRIITDNNGNFLKIVEYKEATEKERKIRLCNSGIMVFAPGILQQYLPQIIKQKPLEKELYLTDIVEICQNSGEKTTYMLCADQHSVVGINTQEELAEANQIISKKT